MTLPAACIGANAAEAAHAAAPAAGYTLVAPPHPAAAAMWHLLEGYVRHRLADGAVLVPDTLGRWHRLMLVEDPTLLAQAEVTGRGPDQAVLSTGLADAISDACFGLWATTAFVPQIGPALPGPPIPTAEALPLGLERLAAELMGADARAALELREQALARAIRLLPDCRLRAARAMRDLCLRWIWAHEIGHLTLNHLAVGDPPADSYLTAARLARVLNAGPDGSVNTRHDPLSPVLALEIAADGFATRLTTRGTPPMTPTMEAVFAASAAVVHMIFDAEAMIQGRDTPTEEHPGAWFRLWLALRDHRPSAKGGALAYRHAELVGQRRGPQRAMGRNSAIGSSVRHRGPVCSGGARSIRAVRGYIARDRGDACPRPKRAF